MKFVHDGEEEGIAEVRYLNGRVQLSHGKYGLVRDAEQVFDMAEEITGAYHPDEADAYRRALKALKAKVLAELRCAADARAPEKKNGKPP